jgi:acyl-CoA synthetase (NDP forming)
MSLSKAFDPRGIAIIGASADPTRIGGHPLRALRNAGYRGGVYPVNPKYPEIAGLKCYPTASAIDGPCDLAIIAVPAPAAPAAVRDAGEAGIAAAIVLTAGFREAGPAGRKLEDELIAAARATGIRLIGPNCQGMLVMQSRVWAVFGSLAEEADLRPGRVSGAFQSGGFGFGIVNLAEQQGVGFRICVSTGNETDVTMPELIGAMLEDAGTDMAFGLLEGTPDARRFLDVGRRSLELGKPVLIWKSAITEQGAKAAASHTANMTGSSDLWHAALRQSGIIEVDDVEPITDIAKLVAQGRMPKGPRVGVLSISGGSSIVFADRATVGGLTFPAFARKTHEALSNIIPAFGSVHNPADVTAGVFNNMAMLTSAIEIVLDDPGIDQVVLMLASIPGPPALLAAEAIAAAARRTDKPVVLVWSGRRSKSEPAYAVLEEAKVPIVPTPSRMAAAMARLTRFAMDRERLLPRLKAEARAHVHPPSPPWAGSHAGSRTLSEVDSKRLLTHAGIPVSREVLVPPGSDPLDLAGHLKPPFAVKIVSAGIAHKSDIGGVRLGISTHADLAAAVADVTGKVHAAAPSAQIDGVIVAEMARGLEVLIGVVNDASFGPAVALGMGGVTAEITKDVTYRIAPFGLATAREMITDLKAAPLFRGYRGSQPADVEALADMLVKVSQLAWSMRDQLSELDINPVFVAPPGQGVVAADALAVLTSSARLARVQS